MTADFKEDLLNAEKTLAQQIAGKPNPYPNPANEGIAAAIAILLIGLIAWIII